MDDTPTWQCTSIDAVLSLAEGPMYRVTLARKAEGGKLLHGYLEFFTTTPGRFQKGGLYQVRLAPVDEANYV